MWKQLSIADRILLVCGHLFFLVLILCCLFLYQERLLAFDTAYYTFHLLTYEEFFIKHGRYISYLTQWVPLLGIHLHWPLPSVFSSFSVSFYIWFYLFFILISHGFRSISGGTLLVFALCLGMRYKFFAAISEITFAIAIAALLIAWLANRPARWQLGPIDFLIVGLCLLGLFGAHLAVFVPIAAFLIFQRLYEWDWMNWKQWVMPMLIFGVLALKFFFVQGDSYESDKMSALFDPNLIKDLYENPGDYFIYTALKSYLIREYLPLLIAFLGSVVWLFSKGKTGAGILILLTAMAWLGSIILTYSYLRGPVYIMLDGYLAVFGLIAGIPFYYFLKENRQTTWAIAAVGLIVFSTIRMVEKRHFYRQRLTHIQGTFALHPEETKLLVPQSLFEWDVMWYPYEIPHESLMLTALDGPETCKTIFINIDAVQDADWLESSGFLQFNGALDIHALNRSPYFELAPQPYIRVDTVSWK